jgi:integrase
VVLGNGRRLLMEGPNPFHGYRMRGVDNSRWRVATDAEIAAILEYCGTHGGDLAETYRLCIRLGVECGARLEEIVSIRKEHLDRPRERIRLLDTKNRGSRFIYPPPELYRAIMEHVAVSPVNPWLFPSLIIPEKPVNKDTVGHFFAQACTDLGLNAGVEDRRGRLVFHSLRHTYGTRQVMADCNLMKLKRLMGHSSLTTTERYVHLAEDFIAGGSSGGFGVH